MLSARSTLAAAGLFFALVVPLGCSGAGQATSHSTSGAGGGSGGSGGGTGGSGGSGGTGGAPADKVCVSSPKPAAFPGTDDCPAPEPAAADTFDDALTAGG